MTMDERSAGTALTGKLDPAVVSVVITTYNHAALLGDALDSVRGQTRPPDEIIVVDDGSKDEPEAVVARYPGVRIISQSNQGLSAARNTGMRAATGRYILFLDADDLLLPQAIELGLRAHQDADGAAFVYGGHRKVDMRGQRLAPDTYEPIGPRPFERLLRGNAIGMHGTVLFDRGILLQSGGYDVSLRRCEDYDVYLRLARAHRIASYPEMVADYRFHGTNMSNDRSTMLASVLDVLDRHAAGLNGSEAQAAREGRRIWRDYYAEATLQDARQLRASGGGRAFRDALLASIRISPRPALRAAWQRIEARLPAYPRDALRRQRDEGTIAVGHWRMGDFARTEPASLDFGFDRGVPVDRYYVEAFLAAHSADIKGRVLEVAGDAYSRQFGGNRITQQDILHGDPGNPRATLVGDISEPDVLPANTFDCIVFTQTLHFIFDMRAAVTELHKALRPGGVLLATVPGISQVDRGSWGENWYWSMTPMAARRLFGEAFGGGATAITAYGNVYAATTFLTGLAQSEVETAKLDIVDPAYPVVVGIRAVRQHAG